MNEDDVRRGVTQAKQNQSLLGVFGFQALVIAAIAGSRSRSWIVGVLVFLGVAIFSGLCARLGQRGRALLSLVAGAGWSVAAFYLLRSLGVSDDATFGIALLAFLIGAAGNFSALQYMRDANRPLP
jgi:hypothetical protein